MPDFRNRPVRTSSRIGQRDTPVQIEARVSGDGVDDSGFPTDGGDSPAGWTTLEAVEWMQRMDLGGRERYVAGQIAAPFDSQWNLGYRADMDPDLVDVAKLRRLVHQNRTYDIVSGSVIGRHESIDLLTLSRVG